MEYPHSTGEHADLYSLRSIPLSLIYISRESLSNLLVAAQHSLENDNLSSSTSNAPSTAPSSVQRPEEFTSSHPAPHLKSFRLFDNVIFELNNVFLRNSKEVKNDKRLKEVKYDVITSLPWSKFEKGLISQEECRAQLLGNQEFDSSEEDITIAMQSAMSWQPSPEMLTVAAELRGSHNIYAVGNLPQPVVDALKESTNSLGLFTTTIVSSQLHERLPHIAILSEVLESLKIDPKRTLYVGDHIDSVITARSFGFHAIQHKDTASCSERIKLLCSEPIARAKSWLRSNAGSLDLTTSLGITVKDSFQQYCILDATGDKSLIYYDKEQRLFSWYYGPPPKGLKQFPPDVDCNALACSALDHLDDATKHSLMDTMLKHVDSSGILQGYFSEDKVRVDILMCVNGLAIFHEYGRGHQLAPTEDWLYRVMVTRAFRDGTHYYPSADVFLYFVSRMLRKAPLLCHRFGAVLRDCVLERKEASGDALAIACRLVAAARCGIRDEQNMEKLLLLQREDGSWDAGVVYQFTRFAGVAYHQGLTVALAVLAIEEWDALRKA